MEQTPLYEDPLVCIRPDEIVLKHYYFPFLKSKTIPRSSILEIEARRATLFNGKGRIFGTGMPFRWYPFDVRRSSRNVIFFARMTNQRVVPAFTVQDEERVQAILFSWGILRREA